MKYYLLCFVMSLFMITSQAQSSGYSFNMGLLGGDSINASYFQGKKLLVLLVDISQPDTIQLRKYKRFVSNNNDSVNMLVMPVSDFNSTDWYPGFRAALLAISGEGFIVAKVTSARQTSGSLRHPFIRWLADRNQNGHYELNFNTPGQLLVLNRNGALKANIERPQAERMRELVDFVR